MTSHLQQTSLINNEKNCGSHKNYWNKWRIPISYQLVLSFLCTKVRRFWNEQVHYSSCPPSHQIWATPKLISWIPMRSLNLWVCNIIIYLILMSKDKDIINGMRHSIFSDIFSIKELAEIILIPSQMRTTETYTMHILFTNFHNFIQKFLILAVHSRIVSFPKIAY